MSGFRANLLNTDIVAGMESALESGNSNSLSFDDILDAIISPKFVISLGIIIIGIVIWRIYKRAYKRFNKRNGPNGITNLFFSTLSKSIIRVIVIFIAIISVLQVYGINITSVVTGVGLLSAIVGLALQDFLKDMIMGFHITSDAFFKVGDVIEYNGITGEVVSFTLKTTKLRRLDDDAICAISNRNISEVSRLTGMVDINLPLSYDLDSNEVHKVLKKCCEKIAKLPDVTSSSYQGTTEFGESAILYKVRFFCDPKNKMPIRRSVLMLIQNELAAAGYSIPYNQLDIHNIS